MKDERTPLGELIESRAGRMEPDDVRVSLRVQRVARVIAPIAFVLMLAGLLGYFSGSTRSAPPQVPGPEVIGLQALLHPTGAWPSYAMSIGLLLLGLIPGITVISILVDHIAARRWREAAVALGVVTILMLSILLGRA